MIVWQLIHDFWAWGVGGFAAAATLADAMKGFSWCKRIFKIAVARVFGQATLRKDMQAMSDQMTSQLQLIAKELKPNGGSSLRDVVDAIDNRQVLQYERVKALSMDTANGVQEFDARGELVWANRTYLRWVERDLTECVGYGWTISVHPADRDKVKADWQEAIRQERAYEGSYRVLTTDGEVIQISVRATVMRSQGRVIGFITTVGRDDRPEPKP